MSKNILKNRTKSFAIKMILFCESLDKSNSNIVIGKQLIRCSTSIGANYRAASRAKSKADFINKLKIVEEEADETMYFLELLMEINQNMKPQMEPLHSEANEILSMVVASIKTSKQTTNSTFVIRKS